MGPGRGWGGPACSEHMQQHAARRLCLEEAARPPPLLAAPALSARVQNDVRSRG